MNMKLFFMAHNDLTRALAEWLPQIVTIDGINGKAAGQEEHLKFTRKEHMHVEL